LQGACPLAQNRGAGVEARTSYEAAEFLMLEGMEGCHASRTGRHIFAEDFVIRQ
jgi:hypothetical protein